MHSNDLGLITMGSATHDLMDIDWVGYNHSSFNSNPRWREHLSWNIHCFYRSGLFLNKWRSVLSRIRVRLLCSHYAQMNRSLGGNSPGFETAAPNQPGVKTVSSTQKHYHLLPSGSHCCLIHLIEVTAWLKNVFNNYTFSSSSEDNSTNGDQTEWLMLSAYCLTFTTPVVILHTCL